MGLHKTEENLQVAKTENASFLHEVDSFELEHDSLNPIFYWRIIRNKIYGKVCGLLTFASLLLNCTILVEVVVSNKQDF